MIFFDVLVWLAVAKIAVLLVEDASYAVRGKQSPRRLARARHAAQEQAKDPKVKNAGAAPAGGGRSWAAADGYLAGLIEDATAKSRARRRRAVARKEGATAVDGVFVDVAEDGRWHADCDLCGWTSRPFRIEDNALAAGREHTRTQHPDHYSGETKEDNQDSSTEETNTTDSDDTRPGLRLIRGGAAEEPPATPEPLLADLDAELAPEPASDEPEPAPAPLPEPSDRFESSVVHDTCFYCLGCPTCTPPTYAWQCRRCGAGQGGFGTHAEAQTSGAGHVCSDPAEQALTEADRAQTRAELFGLCGHRTASDLPFECDNPPEPDSPYCHDHQRATVAHPDAVPMAATGSTSTINSKEIIVNLEATGPEEIRAAFTQAAETAGERSEEIAGIAGILTEAADRYEGLEMAASTVGHLRDAAEAFASAQAALTTAQEELQAALADFNGKDGAVAEAVADAGGNVASKEVLVG